LGITVLLAFSVFMLAIAESMPETSEYIPLISIYLTTVMAMTSISVMMTVFVLNLHYRGPKRNEIPFWLQQLLGLSLASAIKTLKTNGFSWRKKKSEKRKARDKSRSSYLSRTDSFAPVNGLLSYKLNETVIKQTNERSKNRHSTQYENLLNRDNFNHNLNDVNEIPMSHSLDDPSMLRDDKRSPNYHHFSDDLNVQTPRVSVQRLSRSNSTIQEEIHQTLHSLLLKQKQIERDQQIASDWRTVATKVDKILFWIFLFLTIISTLGLLVIAPLFRTNMQRKTKIYHGSKRP
ncbi:unnamed protein product, partial [Didymodactylos carnosus]